MASTAGTQNSPQCWECLRRVWTCDGSSPACGNCAAAGITCPGYENKKPLVWLAMNRVTRPSKRTAGGKGKRLGSPVTMATDRATSSSSKRTNKRPSPSRSTTSNKSAATTAIPPSSSSTSSSGRRPETEVRFQASPLSDSLSEAAAARAKGKRKESNSNPDLDVDMEPSLSSGDTPSVFPDEGDPGIINIFNQQDLGWGGEAYGHLFHHHNDLGAAIDPSLTAAWQVNEERHGEDQMHEMQQQQTTGKTYPFPEEGLKPSEWDAIEGVAFFNSYIRPRIITDNLIPCSIIPTTPLSSDYIHSRPIGGLFWLISLVLAHRMAHVSHVHGIGLDASLTHASNTYLRSSFQAHFAQAIQDLNTFLSEESSRHSDEVLYHINSIITAELMVASTLNWRAHLDGFLVLVRLRGGFRQLITSSAHLRPLLSMIVTTCVMANTTSPPQDQITGIYESETAEICEVYGASSYYVCPRYLFLDITTINRLRVRVATGGAAVGDAERKAILRHINAFSVQAWMDSHNMPCTEESDVIGRMFQSAVAAYCILTLPCDQNSTAMPSTADALCDSQSPDMCQCINIPRLYEFHRARLFKLIGLALESGVGRAATDWPVVVSGVMAADGTAGERAMVETFVDRSGIFPGVGSSRAEAKPMLRKFWASGRTSWDDCFDRPYHLMQ